MTFTGDLMADIATVLKNYDDVLVDGGGCEISVDTGKECYTVEMDDFDWDGEADETPVNPCRKSRSVKNHADILYVVLYVLGQEPHRSRSKGLTTDGDHKSCEAILTYEGNDIIIKVY